MIGKQSLRRHYPDQVWKYIPGYHLSHCSVAPHCGGKGAVFLWKKKGLQVFYFELIHINLPFKINILCFLDQPECKINTLLHCSD
jgi:hypothetical protein